MTVSLKPGRIACVVPFCRRTAKRQEGVAEVICAKHYRLADRELRSRYRKACKQIEPLLETPFEHHAEAEARRLMEKFNRIEAMWTAIKRQSIEAAGGIG